MSSWVQQLSHVQKTAFHGTPPHSLPLTFSLPPPCDIPGALGGGGDKDVPFRAERLVSYSQRFDQLCVSALTAAHR